MNENKQPSKKNPEICLSGKVIRRPIARGSKSERCALYLQTATEMYQLRKLGGNPFQDKGLEALAGKTVTVTGIITEQLLLAREIKEVPNS